MLLPLLCGCVALLEYLLLPNNSRNARPWSYVWVLGAAMCAYLLCLCVSLLRKRRGEKRMYEKLYYKAPHFQRCSSSSPCTTISRSRRAF